MSQETVRETQRSLLEATSAASGPGLVLLFSGQRPYMVPLPLRSGALALGREELSALRLADDHVSRRHLSVELEGESLRIRDLGSTNGVFVNGARLQDPVVVSLHADTVIRLGRTLLLVVPDLAPFEAGLGRDVVHTGIVAGPRLSAVHRQIAALASAGQGLFIRGESGAGKEIAARIFHEHGPRKDGPLVAVNCATIPKELAERLLFGAVRGAYSGAVADAPGYVQAARGGTLFLDEVAELDLSVQAKLLRVLETREVTPLGGTRPQPVQFGLCAATLRDLREAVAAQRFREDLYYRIGRPEVLLPPLRQRRDEIPFLIDETVRAAGLSPSAVLVEACLLREWPGNVRELCSEVKAATALASAESSVVVLPSHLAAEAGRSLTASASGPVTRAPTEAPTLPPVSDAVAATKAPDALVSAASDALGLAHKTILKLLPATVLLALDAQWTREQLDTEQRARALRTAATQALFELLESKEFNQTDVASTLGMSRTTLIKLMDDLGIPRATDLDAEAIQRALGSAKSDVDAAARLLRVSSSALRKRMQALGLSA